MNCSRITSCSLLLIFFLGFISSGLAYSPPKIVEVTDNFGNVYDVKNNWGHEGNTFARIYEREQEVVISQETEITLCVTEVEHEEGRELEYGFGDIDTSHPGVWKDDNCHTFTDYAREDYSESLGWFNIFVKDDADVTARTRTDFEFQLVYRNTSLPEDTDTETETTVYDTVKVSQDEFDSLKEQSAELDSKNEEVTELENQLSEKKSTINQLETELDEKESKIEQLNNRVDELEQKVEELQGGILGSLRSIF